MQENCGQCKKPSKLRRREFSDQALSALIIWGEIDKKNVDCAMCDNCYSDLREILIDRADEILTAKAPDKGRKKAKKSKVA